MKLVSTGNQIAPIDLEWVKSRLLVLRGEEVLLDRDVAFLYGVQTREINQAIRNNPGKFPEGYTFQLSAVEFHDWKSKILISNLSDDERAAIKMGMRRAPMALKGEVATRATLAIIETYAQVRGIKRELVALHKETDAKKRELKHTVRRIKKAEPKKDGK